MSLIRGREEKVFRGTLLFILVASSALMVACSSSPDQEQAASEQALAYAQAVENSSWEQVCEMITVESQDLILEQSQASSCPQAYRRLSKQDRALLKSSASGAEVISTEVNQQQAGVTMKTKQGQATVPLLEEDGQWRVNLVSSPPPESAPKPKPSPGR